MTLADGAESFEVTVLESTQEHGVVLFAVGAGGNPDRHLPLLTFLASTIAMLGSLIVGRSGAAEELRQYFPESDLI